PADAQAGRPPCGHKPHAGRAKTRAIRPILSSHAPSPPTISTLSLPDALPISDHSQPPRPHAQPHRHFAPASRGSQARNGGAAEQDRKSTRLNSSHVKNSYAVFCLKKKNGAQLLDLLGAHRIFGSALDQILVDL